MIPRQLHQTWKNEDIPVHLRPYVQSWRDLHPGWPYTLWTDEMNRSFIADHYPGFLHIYDGYATTIQRVDAVRYFILYTYGGVFIDLDFECLKPVGPLLEGAGFVVGLEPQEHAATHHRPFIISNAFMAGAADNPFLAYICNRIMANDYTRHAHQKGFNAILECAGPFMLSRACEAYPHKQELRILSHELLYPLVKDDKTDRVNSADRDNKQVTGGAYALHHYWGSWWR